MAGAERAYRKPGGRYEPIRMSHWSYDEMQAAFDFSLEDYIYFGGYPGSASLIRDETDGAIMCAVR